jgi:hypothetical protein
MVCAAALGLLRKREQDLRWLVANPFWLPAPLEPLFERLNYSAVDVAYLLAACLTDQKVALPSHHPVLPRGPPLSPPRAATWPSPLTTPCCHVAGAARRSRPDPPRTHRRCVARSDRAAHLLVALHPVPSRHPHVVIGCPYAAF